MTAAAEGAVEPNVAPPESVTADVAGLISQPADLESTVSPWVTAPASKWITEAAQVATAVAGAAYGFGWIVAARFYGEFGLSPEDVGISFGWVAIRVFLVALATLLLLLGARFLLRTADRYATLAWVVSARVITAVWILVALALSALIDVVVLTMHLANPLARLALLVLLPVVIVAASWSYRYRQRRRGSVRGYPGLFLRGTAAALVGLVVTMLVMAPDRMASSLTRQIRAGHPVSVYILPGIPILQVPRVSLIEINDLAGANPATVTPASGICVMRLGASDGTTIYWNFQTQRILRINDQNVITVGPC